MNFYIWSFISTLFVFLILHPYVLSRFSPRKIFLIAITIFFVFFVNLGIKRPVFEMMFHLFNISERPSEWPLWFIWLALLVAPVTEEGMKALPFIFTYFKKELKEERDAFLMGFVCGFGFGIGEIWYLAVKHSILNPEITKGNFFRLIGFFGERTVAVMVHSFLTAILGYGISRGRFLKNFFIVMILHYLLNIGAAFYQSGRINIWLALYISALPILVVFYIFFKKEKKVMPKNIHSKKIYFTQER